MTQKQEVVQLVAPNLKKAYIEVVGTMPLICHRWGAKATKEIEDKEQHRAKAPREARNPQKEYEESLYPMGNGKFGFPSIGFKAAMVRAGTYSNMKMTFLRGAFYIPGELVEINGTPEMRTDHVRVQMSATMRYRGEFKQWSAKIPIIYNESVISLEQLSNLVMLAGFSVGVGEWRAEKDGQYGAFALKEGVQEPSA